MTLAIPGDRLDPQSIKGFLAHDEGEALHARALEAAAAAPGALMEIGTWCGRSSVYLGRAARDAGRVLFAVDHHRGSEEHQPGEGYHDRDLFDAELGRVDTLPALRRTLALADLEAHVIAVVGKSASVGAAWSGPLAFVFIDGGHAMDTALADYRAWAGHVARGGLLAIHDVFPDPKDGGRPPYEIWKLAVASGLFEPAGRVNTLEFLRRV
ncbi:MAG: class I SAM-dependent methyltransferase [Oceanicaulis sp.]